ncbi:lytic transglycosylase domain-containing protein [Photobacterium sp. TY1-4]|uniref:lytic transglycosylase domain-containing protein n=1 Tax=Photobacterium sp. TY1-4 TaxID=2899122 RepID=UPI0021C1FDFE|nr:lytic transglycosylase domain-containing protein [Photobacterium sp. TY1-4]UXI03108.1 lytic transglycosylase domain-containing protein [Photobacterium sp. TY1-4]
MLHAITSIPQHLPDAAPGQRWLRAPSKLARILMLAGSISLGLLQPSAGYAAMATATAEQLSILQIEDHYQALYPHKQLIEQQYQHYPRQVAQIFRLLKQHHLPSELALIPMMESSFNPQAVSPAGAGGLWQLMPATAQRFGLTVNDQADERFDLDRSTEAAVRYLAFLDQKFDQNLPLILAAYNAGEGRVQRTLAQQPDTPFSALELPQETLSYVHKFYALKDLLSLTSLAEHSPAAESIRPLNTRQKQQLAALFARREIIDMSPIAPLVAL